MKTEHRHELKANDLEVATLRVESFYERHAASMQWGIIGVAFLIACGIYYWRTTSALEAAAWNELSQSQSADDYAQVASDYSGSKAASWAKLREANSYLETYLRDAFENREKANTDLKKAKEILEGLVKQNGPKEFKQQVLFGYARNLEMSSNGDVKPAIEAYENLIKEIPDTIFKREAEHRIRALNSPSAKEFYAFFSKQNPNQAAPPKPNDAKAGAFGAGDPFKALTPGLNELHEKAAAKGDGGVPFLSPPKLPEVRLPDDAKTDEKPAAEAPKTEEPAADKKSAAEPAPKTEEKPAAEPEKKAEEKPAAEPEKKAEEKPAQKKPE